VAFPHLKGSKTVPELASLDGELIGKFSDLLRPRHARFSGVTGRGEVGHPSHPHGYSEQGSDRAEWPHHLQRE